MATLNTLNPTLADVAARTDGQGNIITNIVELLNETNDVLTDMTFIEANNQTEHKTTIRSGLPSATWRKLYHGVPPSKSAVVTVRDTVGMLEAYAEIDKDLADLNGNSAAWRLSEQRAFVEAMNQEMATTLWYGDTSVHPERFTGLAPRYSSMSAENGRNILDGGGQGADNTSIWLLIWGQNTLHGIYPKGSKAGLQHRDLGEDTLRDANGNPFQGYRTHYKWNMGLCLRDWRYAVRIANIKETDLRKDASAGADLIDLMTQALELVPNLNMGRAVFYCNRNIRSFLRRMIAHKVINSTLTMDNVAGKHVVSFDGVPVRISDAILSTEARIAA